MLLSKNGFSEICVNKQLAEHVRENREGFIEIKGRGCWHQIDCPCDYKQFIPFSYPLRLLGEAKFYNKQLSKKYIREYIGIVKDIQENYFVSNGTDLKDSYPRRTEIGVYFAANGFQKEAEKLAYAHGIKTVSYANNYLVDRIKRLIEEFEAKYLSVRCIKEGNWNMFREALIETMKSGAINKRIFMDYCSVGYTSILYEMRNSIMEIKSSFFATTATGVFLHFVGSNQFPEEVFSNTDTGFCNVRYERADGGQRVFWLEIIGDYNHGKFYFTPPESLDYAAVFGKQSVLDEKEILFKALNINVELNGIMRSLILHLDQDWFEESKK